MYRRLLLLVCLAALLPARAVAGQACSISVSIYSPSDRAVIADLVSIEAGVTSACQLQSVVASMPGQTMALSFDTGSQHWKADVSMTPVPFGTVTLTVTATDIFGNTRANSVQILHDAPPTVIVDAPAEGDIARPYLHVKVRCVDDDPAGCALTRVLIGVVFPDTLASGTSSIDQDLFFPSGYGNSARIAFAVWDSNGAVRIVYRTIYIEPSPRLVETFRAPGTVVLDDAATRAVFVDQNGQVCLFDKTTSTTTVMLGGQAYSARGWLTPLGAMFAAAPAAGGETRVYEWRNGALLNLGHETSPSLRVAGSNAIWIGSLTTANTLSLYLRDLTAGTTTLVDASAAAPADVSATGDVVYAGANNQIWRYRAGVTTAITAAKPGVFAPVTDGINVAYQLKAGGTYSTWLVTTSGEIVLDPGGAGTADPTTDYAVTSGVTAFTKRAIDGSPNLWMRAADGTQTQTTFFGDAVKIKALNADGRAAVQRGANTYIVGPGAAPSPVASTWSNVFWRGSDLFLVIGRSVFRVLPLATGTYTGDADGDALTDMIRVGPNGAWQIKKSSNTFGAPATFTLGADGDTPVAGDFDGDGVQDPAVYQASTGTWTVLKSSAPGAPPFTVHWGGPSYIPVPGDYDGDGKTDPAVYQRSTGWWFILKSSSGYVDSISINWGGPGYTAVGNQDFDGDGRTDLVAYRRATGTWYVLLSGSSYTTTISATLGGPGQSLVPGDYDGDHKADFAIYDRVSGGWHALTSSSGYSTTIDVNWGGAGYLPVPGDYDGDGRIDPAVFLPATGNWHVLRSGSGYTSSFTIADTVGSAAPLTSAIAIGAADAMRASDVDDDGASDISVYNASNGYWYTLTSSSSYAGAVNTAWGGDGYTPVPGDFDGDGKADRAVYQAATGWMYVLLSGANFTTSMAKNLGGAGWTPVPGDYDGDGKTDFVVYNPASGQWYGLLSGAGYAATLNVVLGGSGWTPVPGDYDGDGRTDLGIYAAGTWMVRLAAANFVSGFSKIAGGAGDVPVPGDYDGDGKTDFVVYNTSSGVWSGLKSSSDYTTTLNVGWGGTGYTPVKGDYDGDGRADLGVYQESTGMWYILLSGANYTTTITKNWGGTGYLAVPQYP